VKTMLMIAVVAAVLVAAAAWALAGPKPAVSGYQVEVRDVAGVSAFMVVPEVVAVVPGYAMMPEVVVTPRS
jgi:hypothetical protein